MPPTREELLIKQNDELLHTIASQNASLQRKDRQIMEQQHKSLTYYVEILNLNKAVKRKNRRIKSLVFKLDTPKVDKVVLRAVTS